MSLTDAMGQLQHARGGRIATGGANEHGDGRLPRREDAARPKKPHLISREAHRDLDVRQAPLERLRVTGPGSREIEVRRACR